MSRTQTKANRFRCPRCGSVLDLQPHPEREGRVVGYCECNQDRGPVIDVRVETANELLAIPEATEKEQGDDSTVS